MTYLPPPPPGGYPLSDLPRLANPHPARPAPADGQILETDDHALFWYYWAAVLATFALGTAVGDLTADTLGLGYLASGVGFAVLMAVPALAYWKFGMNPVLAFWFAYVVTRPAGASFADWMASPLRRGGLGWGVPLVGAGLVVAVVAMIAFMAVTGRDRTTPTSQTIEASPVLAARADR